MSVRWTWPSRERLQVILIIFIDLWQYKVDTLIPYHWACHEHVALALHSFLKGRKFDLLFTLPAKNFFSDHIIDKVIISFFVFQIKSRLNELKFIVLFQIYLRVLKFLHTKKWCYVLLRRFLSLTSVIIWVVSKHVILCKISMVCLTGPRVQLMTSVASTWLMSCYSSDINKNSCLILVW